jgi:hypothetical protein
MKSGFVSWLGWAWLALSLGGGVVAGCGKVAEPDGFGGETHWLRQCSQPGDCGELECLCGVCTAACDGDATCGAIVPDARCVARGEAAFAADCSERAPARLCAEAPADPAPGPGGDAPLACEGGKVVVFQECLECDAARSAIAERLDSLISASGWDTCESDTDCVSQEWSTPCDGQCPVAIASASSAEFEAAIPGFATLVCDPNQWRMSCGNPSSVDCNVAPLCVDGTCRIGTLACADRSIDACEEDGACSLSRGSPYNAAAACFRVEFPSVGCVDPDLSCPPVITAALDAEGNCFSFGGCLPNGFTPAPEGHPCRAALADTCAE